MLERDRKGFNALRIFAIFALCCTVVLWAGLWIASATPADKSGQDTQAVTDKLDSKYNLNYKFNQKVVTQHVAFDEDTTYSGYYAGETLKTELVFMPKNTLDKAVRYKSSDTSVATVSEDGVITFLSRGESRISVYLVSNPEVYNYVGVACFGKNPKTSGLTLALDAPLKVGTTTMVSLNEDGIAPRGAKYKSSDESVLKVDKQGYVSGISEGNATLTATVKGVSASINVTVSQNPEYIKPERINLKQNVTLTHGYKMDAYNLIDSVYPQGAPKNCVVNTSSSSLGVVYKDLAPRLPGTYTVTFTSRYDESVTASVEVTVVKVAPTELRVSGPAVTTPNSKTKFTAKHMPQYYEDDVTWEIVSGKGSISSDGVFVNEGFGTTVIRCRSTLDPTLYVDKTVESKLFSDAYSMVRKFMGHGGLSALLGFGIFGTLLLLSKHKYNALIFTAPLGFIYAGFSELIQKFTPGRFCTIADVLIDFIGTLIGMTIAIILVVIVCVIWRLANKKSFKNMLYEWRLLTLSSAFRKTYVQDEYALPVALRDDVDEKTYVDDALTVAASDVDETDEK